MKRQSYAAPLVFGAEHASAAVCSLPPPLCSWAELMRLEKNLKSAAVFKVSSLSVFWSAVDGFREETRAGCSTRGLSPKLTWSRCYQYDRLRVYLCVIQLACLPALPLRALSSTQSFKLRSECLSKSFIISLIDFGTCAIFHVPKPDMASRYINYRETNGLAACMEFGGRTFLM